MLIANPKVVKPKKAFQLYNEHFSEFVTSIDTRPLNGPLTLAIVVEDGNGEVYSWIKGPEHRLRILNFALKERLDLDFGSKKSWIRLKLKNGLKRLSDLI